MTPEAFVLLVASCGITFPPGITVDRLSAIAAVESGRDLSAISPPNRDGSRDYGLLQLNSQWIGRPGFPATVVEAMEPCANVAAGIRILADADRQAACIYNAGRPNCRSGYPEKIVSAAAQLGRPSAPVAPVAVPAAAPVPPPCAPEWDSWALARCQKRPPRPPSPPSPVIPPGEATPPTPSQPVPEYP